MAPQLKRPPEAAVGDEILEVDTKKIKRENAQLEPTSYQLEVLEVARSQNTIAVLDTGVERTMTAVMLINHVWNDFINSPNKSEKEQRRRLIVFLAPTVHLVMQQFEVIKQNTSLEVEYYHGRKGVDTWTADIWEKELSLYQVIVMTPQILLDALRKAFITLDLVRLVILDDCHQATGKHPYSVIMTEFYHKAEYRPSIFGMTASPVIRKGVSSSIDCEVQLSELESLLVAKIYTTTERSEVDSFVPSAKQVNKYYNSNPVHFDGLREKLQQLLSLYDGEIANLQNAMASEYKDLDVTIKDYTKRLSTWLNCISVSLDEGGLIFAIEATKLCMESNQLQDNDLSEVSAASVLSTKFLERVLDEITDNFVNGYEDFLSSETGCKKALELGYLSPKVHELIQIFLSFGESSQVRCLIFMERIMTAKVMECLMRKIGFLSHFTSSYLCGGSSDLLSPKKQKETLDSFRGGKVNLIFTTDVAEEGIHIPDCSYVIRFDLPKTVRSYVLSCGRARQIDSQFFIMLERGNMQQRDLLFDILRSKYAMMDTAVNRDPDEALSPETCTYDKVEGYCIKSTDAEVTISSSISAIYKYCEKLPRDEFYIPRPMFEVENCGIGSYKCKLTLPPSSAFQTLVGPTEGSSHKAKQSACLEACKKLHQMGALNDYPSPCPEVLLDNLTNDYQSDKDLMKPASNNGEGTTRLKELHSRVAALALSGTWARKNTRVELQGYRFDFLCNLPEIKYSSFVLLVDSLLDKDVGSLELDLYLIDKMVKATVSPCGPIVLDQEQVEKAKRFQEFFFNGLFGRLVMGKKSAGQSRKFLLNEEPEESLWREANMYLLLPTDSSFTETVHINWRGIESAASAVQFLKDSYQNSGGTFSSVDKGRKEGEIYLANKKVEMNELTGAVVMAVHSGKIYLVLDVLPGLTANSPFDGVTEKSGAELTTFTEYFSKKYDVVLQYPSQPMVLLKHSHNAHNLLYSHAIVTDGSNENKKHKKLGATKKPEAHAHMPPELLIHIDIPVDVLKSFYLLPSMMYRIESLMLASELRSKVGYNPTDRCIPCSLILEALSTLRASEDFSFERLELLGDSVLKYAVSCYVFFKYPNYHEGQLSNTRTQIICNANLHRLGIRRKIQAYIRDEAFDPRRWVAPGQVAIFTSKCSCSTKEAQKVLGKTCDEGHRWMCSKTISDCVEALIGAYYIGGGLDAAFAFLKWLDNDIDPVIREEAILNAIKTASLRDYAPKIDEIKMIEEKIGYEYSVKGLLLEAIMHPTQQDSAITYCYQRLEFLGDSVLDILITSHLYEKYTDVDPGELTDLRSASVNNGTFAQAAVEHKLHVHLQHGSELLLQQITSYVGALGEYLNSPDPENTPPKGPKVLGDIVESIIGAILIDTKFNLNKVWEIVQLLLSPLVTPESLEFPPFRELSELCSQEGYPLVTKCVKNKDGIVTAVLQVQLPDLRVTRTEKEKNTKEAKGKAAFQLLKDLEKKGVIHSRYETRVNMPVEIAKGTENSEENHITSMNLDIPESPYGNKLPDLNLDAPVLVHVKTVKGSPRTALFDLCKKREWPTPTFDFTQERQSAGGKGGPLIFTSIITLHLPFSGEIKLPGDGRADKKSAQDSAALALLYELQRRRHCQVNVIQAS
ncbi:Protein Dicer [Rhynchospora pubera]|uniref:Protein Dicer n=1 Tax=Rhynchospora pubera TaxID=906938 RepID=A0AAV8D990_9POAL|nr:Protein Dicer [Rhynchospora pubera]